MRFTIHRALDAIEGRLTTDPALARAVVNLGEIISFADLDGGRPVYLLRLGMAIDALSRHLSDDSVSLYVVADRALMQSLELTSNEKMVIRRWADDGTIEVSQSVTDRPLEVAAMTGLPFITRARLDAAVADWPWLNEDGRVLSLAAGAGGAALISTPVRVPAAPRPKTAVEQARERAVERRWRCLEPGCAAFGPSRTHGQPPPHLRGEVAVCPRHDQPLADSGPKPAAVTLTVTIDGLPRRRFTIADDGRSTIVGRAPADREDVELGEWLGDESAQWISRNHLEVALRGSALIVTDTSTNGSVVHTRTSADAVSQPMLLRRGQQHELGEWDTVELHTGVELSRASHARSSRAPEQQSVMGEAPTMYMKLPPSD